MSPRVSLDDLEHALFWVSSPPEFEAEAFVSRSTGRVFTRGPDGPVEDDFPADIEDGNEYIAFPHKHDLDLGRQLVLSFIAEKAPHAASEVRAIFSRKGAYSRFKSLLGNLRLIDDWHEYEREATATALERWASAQGLEVIRPSRHAARDA